MNGKQLFGKNVIIEFSRPGGQCKKFWKGPQNGAHASSNLNCPSPTTTYSSRNSSSTSRCLPSPSSYTPRPPPVTPRWKGNPSGSDGSKSSSSGSSLHGSVSNLCITGYDECSSNNIRRQKKSSSLKKGSSGGGGTLKQPSHRLPWKEGGGGRGGGGGGGGGGRRGKDHDPRFLINEDTIVESNCRDPRTTVMIKNIPNKYRYCFFPLPFLLL